MESYCHPARMYGKHLQKAIINARGSQLKPYNGDTEIFYNLGPYDNYEWSDLNFYNTDFNNHLCNFLLNI